MVSLVKGAGEGASKFYIFKKCDWREMVMTIVGVFLGIGGVALLAHVTGQPFIMAPFGASAVLLYCASSSPLAQPRNFLCSHFIAGFIGITCVNIFGAGWYVAAISVCLAILAMMLTDTVHPPGGATALLIALQGTTDYSFLLTPIAGGVVIMFAAAIISARIFPGVRPYPKK
jgi:CBS-domain-containing membrane protein